MHNPNARLEAFCDGVFAIALTLLIIEIKVPEAEGIHTRKELWLAFFHQWPSWLAFFFSFITILISWVNHSHLFKLLGKAATRFTYSNGLLLLSIILLPFPTAAVAMYIKSDLAQPAVTLYCGVALLNNISWNLIQFSAEYPGILYKAEVNMEKIKAAAFYTRIGFGLYAAAFAISFWFPIAAFAIIALSFLAWLVLGVVIKEADMMMGKS